jgi:hypothetical protein
MPLPDLDTLAADVRRLLQAGGAVAAGDEGLRARARRLHELARQAPVLAPVAAAVDRVTEAPAGPSTAAFFDLLVLVRQINVGLAGAGRDGPLEEVPSSGPWATGAAARDVYAVHEAARSSGARREEALRDGVERGVVADLRLLSTLFAVWRDASDELTDLLVERVLPAVGRSVLPELWAALRQDVRRAAWRLMTICRSNPVVGVELCQLALGENDLMLSEGAVKALGQVRSGATFIIPALIKGLRDPAQQDRPMYARALGQIGPAARDAVPALVAALGDPSAYVRVAAAEALGQVGPAARAALPALTAAQRDAADRDLSRAAAGALGRIQAGK